MELQIPAVTTDLEKEIIRLQPWMHKYKFSSRVFTGYYKYQSIGETCCVSSSPTELVQRMSNAFDDYMQGQPFFFMDHVIRLLGSALPSCSFLDIACATGKFSFCLALRGAGEVYGVEIRQNQIDQCRLIKDIDTRFRKMNIQFQHIPCSADNADFLAGRTFDVVLSMGLLYHLTNPITHLSVLSRLTRRFAVIHTMVHEGPPDYWKLLLEDKSGITKAIEGISWTPHYKGLRDLLLRVGFNRVEVCIHPMLAAAQAHMIAGLTPPPPVRTVSFRWIKQLTKLMARFPALAHLARSRLRFRKGTEMDGSLEHYLRYDQNPHYLTFLAFKD